MDEVGIIGIHPHLYLLIFIAVKRRRFERRPFVLKLLRDIKPANSSRWKRRSFTSYFSGSCISFNPHDFIYLFVIII